MGQTDSLSRISEKMPRCPDDRGQLTTQLVWKGGEGLPMQRRVGPAGGGDSRGQGQQGSGARAGWDRGHSSWGQ